MIYLDTSALIKKYAVEAGTERVRRLLKSEARIFTSVLTYAEVCAALSRKFREGGMEKRHYRKALGHFLNDWSAFALIALHEALFPFVRKLTEVHSLRGADAVHLSSALWMRKEIGHPLRFIASDHRLLDAAGEEGLEEMNPEAD